MTAVELKLSCSCCCDCSYIVHHSAKGKGLAMVVLAIYSPVNLKQMFLVSVREPEYPIRPLDHFILFMALEPIPAHYGWGQDAVGQTASPTQDKHRETDDHTHTHTRIHTQGKCRKASQPHLDVFGLWEETGGKTHTEHVNSTQKGPTGIGTHNGLRENIVSKRKQRIVLLVSSLHLQPVELPELAVLKQSEQS